MAHPGTHAASVSDALHGPWSTLWLPWGMLALSGALYATGVVRLWRKGALGHGLRPWEPLCFAAGWLTIVVAQVSPLAWLSEQLFSAHMTQHELLMLIAAPLLVLGRPLVVMLWALPANGRRRAGTLVQQPLVARPWRVVTAPIVVWTLHGAALWLWHLPAWYEGALTNDNVHLAQHACFLGTAALFWWTIVHGRYGRVGYGMAVLYVFTTMLHSGVLGALFTFAPRAIYPAYARTAPAWNMTAVEDQQLAGLIMWIPFGLVFLVVGLALFAAWMGESDRRLTLGRAHALTSPANAGPPGGKDAA
jgi:cytochrome c oxidase assembly factor CtaG